MKIKSKLTVLGLVPQDSIGFADVFVFGAVMHIVFLRYFLFFLKIIIAIIISYNICIFFIFFKKNIHKANPSSAPVRVLVANSLSRSQEQFTSSWTRLHRANILLRPDLEQNKRRITNK
jgi:hypothetical protein